jgi:hypothetical protein
MVVAYKAFVGDQKPQDLLVELGHLVDVPHKHAHMAEFQVWQHGVLLKPV